MYNILGIDPGASGAIAYFKSDDVKYDINAITAYKCPKEVIDMANLAHKLSNSEHQKCFAYIEQVHAMPHDGRSSLFKFGTNYGAWLGILCSLHHVDCVVKVSPQKWMKWWQIRMGTKLPKIKKDRKNMLKSWAQQCTSQKVTLYNADAILIAMYGYFQELESEINKLENDKIKLLSEKEKLNV
jgi:hypothetical protein